MKKTIIGGWKIVVSDFPNFIRIGLAISDEFNYVHRATRFFIYKIQNLLCSTSFQYLPCCLTTTKEKSRSNQKSQFHMNCVIYIHNKMRSNERRKYNRRVRYHKSIHYFILTS